MCMRTANVYEQNLVHIVHHEFHIILKLKYILDIQYCRYID